jgi:hypothetical protein
MHEDNVAIRGTTSMVELRNLLLAASLSAEERDQIVALARGLRYKARSLNISAANIVECLRLIQHPNVDLPVTLPISSSVLFETNRTTIVWSAFGDLAPTCNFPGGVVIDLSSSKNLPKHIGFRNILLKDAVIDLEQILSTKKFCNTSSNRRSGPYKDRLYTGLEGSQVISAFTAAVGTVTDQGNKRSGGSGNVDTAILDDGF